MLSSELLLIGQLRRVHQDVLQQQQRLLLKQQMLSSHSGDEMLMDELQHVHSGALQLKQQQQEWPSYLNHVLTDVIIDELPRVHGVAL